MAKDVFLASTGQGPGSGRGVVVVAGGRTPTVIDGKKVVKAIWIGTTDTAPDILVRNFKSASATVDPLLLGGDVNRILAQAVGPRASDIADWPDWAKDQVKGKYGTGSAWFTGTADQGAAADWTPTIVGVTAVATAGIGSLITRAVAGRAVAAAGGAEAGAGGATGAETAATAGGGAAAGGAASKAGSAIKSAAKAIDPKKAIGALTVASLFTNIGLWKGLGLTIAGAVLILIGILQLSGLSAGAAARKVVPV